MLSKLLASKLCSYEVVLGNVKVKVNVIDLKEVDSSFAHEKLSEFNKSLSEQRIVGIDHMVGNSSYPLWLILCTSDRCLMIKLLSQYQVSIDSKRRYKRREQYSTDPFLQNPFLKCLDEFLGDKTICFVDVNTSLNSTASKLIALGLECRTDVDIRYLAARCRNNKGLLSLESFDELVVEVDLDIKPRKSVDDIDWNARLFTEDVIVYAIYNVYYSYLIAEKFEAEL